MNYDCGYSTEMVGLLDMVERGCERLMKQGGGGLSQTQVHNGIGLSKCDKTKIVIGYKRGLSLHSIAAEIGVHYNTVVRHTRVLRNAQK
jgi:hypothetical protein